MVIGKSAQVFRDQEAITYWTVEFALDVYVKIYMCVMAVRIILSYVTLGVSFVIKNWPKLLLDKIINKKYSKFGLN